MYMYNVCASTAVSNGEDQLQELQSRKEIVVFRYICVIFIYLKWMYYLCMFVVINFYFI